MFQNLAVPFEENQVEIIDCALFVPYSCSWRMKSRSWCSKGTCIIYISEWTSIIFLVMMRLLRKGTGPVLVQRGRGGEGGTFENYGEGVQHASWKPNPASDQKALFALPYVSFQETSDRKKHTALKTIVWERTSLLCFTPTTGQKPYPLQSKPHNLTVYSLGTVQ